MASSEPPTTHQSYLQYLSSPHWQETRRAYYAAHPRAHCLICKAKPPEASLDLHHLNYRHLGFEETQRQGVDLVALCRPHHELAHQYLQAARSGGNTWVTPGSILKRFKASILELAPPPSHEFWVADAKKVARIRRRFRFNHPRK